MIPVAEDQIGGAVVRRRIDRGNLPALHAGYRMSRDEVMAMPVANRRALVNNEALWLSPMAEHEPARRGRPPNHK